MSYGIDHLVHLGTGSTPEQSGQARIADSVFMTCLLHTQRTPSPSMTIGPNYYMPSIARPVDLQARETASGRRNCQI